MEKQKYPKLHQNIEDLLSSTLKVEQRDSVPPNVITVYNKAYDVRLGAIFVDMRNSSGLYSGNVKELVAKTAKIFDGSVLRILRADNAVEMGVRGNSVFAIYSVSSQGDVENLIRTAAEVNSLVRMLNIIFAGRNLETISVGIGVAESRGLVMKSRCRMLGDRDRIWIADAISDASRFAKMGSSLLDGQRMGPVVISSSVNSVFRNNPGLTDVEVKEHFVFNGFAHHGDIRCTVFEDWITDTFLH